MRSQTTAQECKQAVAASTLPPAMHPQPAQSMDLSWQPQRAHHAGVPGGLSIQKQHEQTRSSNSQFSLPYARYQLPLHPPASIAWDKGQGGVQIVIEERSVCDKLGHGLGLGLEGQEASTAIIMAPNAGAATCTAANAEC